MFRRDHSDCHLQTGCEGTQTEQHTEGSSMLTLVLTWTFGLLPPSCVRLSLKKQRCSISAGETCREGTPTTPSWGTEMTHAAWHKLGLLSTAVSSPHFPRTSSVFVWMAGFPWCPRESQALSTCPSSDPPRLLPALSCPFSWWKGKRRKLSGSKTSECLSVLDG